MVPYLNVVTKITNISSTKCYIFWDFLSGILNVSVQKIEKIKYLQRVLWHWNIKKIKYFMNVSLSIISFLSKTWLWLFSQLKWSCNVMFIE